MGRGSARVDLVARERGSKGIRREGGRITRGRVLMAHHPLVRHKYDYSNGAPPHGAPLLTCPNTECTPPVDRLFSFEKIKENDGNVKKIKYNMFPM